MGRLLPAASLSKQNEHALTLAGATVTSKVEVFISVCSALGSMPGGLENLRGILL